MSQRNEKFGTGCINIVKGGGPVQEAETNATDAGHPKFCQICIPRNLTICWIHSIPTEFRLKFLILLAFVRMADLGNLD